MAKFTFSDPGTGLSFVKKQEKAELVDDGTTLTVLNIARGPSTDFQGKPNEQWVIRFELDGDDTRAIGFPVGDGSRDRFIASLQEYLANDEDAEPTPVRMVKAPGSNYILLEVVEEANA